MNLKEICEEYRFYYFMNKWGSLFDKEDYIELVQAMDGMYSLDLMDIQSISNLPNEYFNYVRNNYLHLGKKMDKLDEKDYDDLFIVISNKLFAKNNKIK